MFDLFGKLRHVTFHEGLYESVVTTEVERRLEGLMGLDVDLGKVDPADHTHVLTRHLAEALERRLAVERDPERKLLLANRMLAAINELVIEDAPSAKPLSRPAESRGSSAFPPTQVMEQPSTTMWMNRPAMRVPNFGLSKATMRILTRVGAAVALVLLVSILVIAATRDSGVADTGPGAPAPTAPADRSMRDALDRLEQSVQP